MRRQNHPLEANLVHSLLRGSLDHSDIREGSILQPAPNQHRRNGSLDRSHEERLNGNWHQSRRILVPPRRGSAALTVRPAPLSADADADRKSPDGSSGYLRSKKLRSWLTSSTSQIGGCAAPTALCERGAPMKWVSPQFLSSVPGRAASWSMRHRILLGPARGLPVIHAWR
jgi:hypothetical protein